MRKFLLLAALALPLLASAIKIETDETDEFTDLRKVVTSWESLDKGYIHVRLRHENNHDFLDFKLIRDGSIVISENNNLFFKSTTDNKAVFTPVSTFFGGTGDGAVGISGSAAWGIYANYTGSYEWFIYNTPKLMRIYTASGYIDKNISEKDGYKLQKLAMLMSGTLKGDSSMKLVSCSLQYLKKKKDKSSWEVVDEEYIKDATADELTEKTEAWKSKTDDKYDYDVKIKKQK